MKSSRAEQSRAEQSNIAGGLAPKRKSKKWILALVGILLVLGIGGGIFGYTQYQKSQTINQVNIEAYLKDHGYTYALLANQAYDNEQTMPAGEYAYNNYGHGFYRFTIGISSSKTLVLTTMAAGQELPADGQKIIPNSSLQITGANSGDPFVKFKTGQWVYNNNINGNFEAGTMGLLTSLSQIPAAK